MAFRQESQLVPPHIVISMRMKILGQTELGPKTSINFSQRSSLLHTEGGKPHQGFHFPQIVTLRKVIFARKLLVYLLALPMQIKTPAFLKFPDKVHYNKPSLNSMRQSASLENIAVTLHLYRLAHNKVLNAEKYETMSGWSRDLSNWDQERNGGPSKFL